MTKTIAIYARQSIEKKESVSIETQIDECKKICDPTSKIKSYEDKGYSGKNTNRPQLQKLIDDIKGGMIKKVVVYKLDRISRNLVDFYNLKQIMDENDCEFASAIERFDTSDTMGRAMMGILAVFAQMERENTQQRVKDNYYYRIQDGRWAGGPAPFGFKNVHHGNFPTLEPVPDELDAVESAFMRYTLKLASLGDVAAELNGAGYRTKAGGTFTNVSVRRILRNPIYVKADETLYKYFKANNVTILSPKKDFNGKFACNIVGKNSIKSDKKVRTTLNEQCVYITRVQGIIDSAKYIMVQNKLSSNKQLRGFSKEGTVLQELAGKIKCKECGYAIKGFTKRESDGMPYLGCYGGKIKKACDVKGVHVNFFELQKEVGKRIQKQIDELENLTKKERAVIEEKERKVANIDAQIKRFIDLIADGKAIKAVSEKLISLEEEKAKVLLDIEIASSAISQTNFIMKLKTHDFYHGKVVYKDLTPKQKRETVQLLIDKILIDKDGEITIKWNL